MTILGGIKTVRYTIIFKKSNMLPKYWSYIFYMNYNIQINSYTKHLCP